MCGITGFADFNQKSSREVVCQMVASMPHRGPDGQSEFFEQQEVFQIGLGHRRLSIIDLSHAADQPMSYEDLVVVFNGEIYNYREIKDELEEKGHRFRTLSDTEVILHSWKEWGKAAIHKWHGMFALVIYDRGRQELIAIRDRAGVKPFYYSFRDGLFLFGSELKTLMAHPAYRKEISPDAAASFLQYGAVPAPYSIFKSTFKLQAGHLLHINLLKRELVTEQYWNVYDYYNKPKLRISLPDAIRETERILEKAFQYRMVADVPVGVFLSGGFDSTCVTALLQKNSTEKIRTFTIGTTDNKLDEAPFAKQIAAHLGTDHTEYYCTAKEAMDIIPELPFYYDEPFADSSAIPTILVSQLARQKVTVALSADAGDEIFAGYNRYDYISRYGNRLQKIPAPARKLAAGLMSMISSESIPILKNKANFHSRYDKLKNLLNDPSPAELLKNLSIVFPDREIGRLFAPVPGGEGSESLSALYYSRELKPEYYDALSFMMAVDYQTYLADDILQKVDRATMSISLEGREPFLDQDIIEWAAQLPTDYKYHKGIKKYILREIVYPYVPKELMDRPKMGFGIPVADWLAGPLKPLVEEYLGDAALARHGLFQRAEVQRLKSDFLAGRKEKHLKIWHLLMFQLWHEKWM
ncbi:asparagine synthase (glutamine-hydrolyzing) [Niabella drilacis]|uniref:asparagine synthase (glutamine-hydrolyzing) n=1 Tax=Niabella drilacis (strain DSM 25811 / CCM 8410 / CCUG 62505 / LMG 26954 / E90) TaxID=1285928 RepID=A0A1G6NQC5_NIADE|nr:asparagine synthase (glutamine-hydrolyzing) [Niabella drilacis]SDC70170.1 asparagine synthase (glutamine-hydrolysing) [Niabella drilacis]